MDKLDLKGVTLQQLQEFIESNGEPKFRAAQILNWLYNKRIPNRTDSLAGMGNLPKDCMNKLLPVTCITSLQTEVLDDGKFSFTAQDGNFLHSAVRGKRLVLSTQVGCGYECGFCIYSKTKLVRNLTTGEIVDQIIKVQAKNEDIKEISFSGMGEPLANTEAVLNAIKIINADWGLDYSFKHISIYSCGVAPQIKVLAEKKLPVRLVVGLHSVDDGIRSLLMNVNKESPVDELLGSIKQYGRATGSIVELEYMLLSGVNDSYADAKLLIKKLLGLPVRLFLTIHDSIPRSKFKAVTFDRQEQFLNMLIAGNIKAEIR